MLRRLHEEQPRSFSFTRENKVWAETQIKKYPAGREASAIIPLLWRAQEQEGWLTRPAIEYVADLLGMAYMRALEVATFILCSTLSLLEILLTSKFVALCRVCSAVLKI